MAEFKSHFLNQFVKDKQIKHVLELGCGDGNQLSYAKYPKYTGFDVSPDAVSMCAKKFSADLTKTFHLLDEYTPADYDLSLSLDVIYHLVEQPVFERLTGEERPHRI